MEMQGEKKINILTEVSLLLYMKKFAIMMGKSAVQTARKISHSHRRCHRRLTVQQ